MTEPWSLKEAAWNRFAVRICQNRRPWDEREPFSLICFFFFRQCESGRSKMAAYFVGSRFAYTVVIWKPISLALPGGIETAWLLSQGSSNPLCCASVFNDVHFILSYLILMERPALCLQWEEVKMVSLTCHWNDMKVTQWISIVAAS